MTGFVYIHDNCIFIVSSLLIRAEGEFRKGCAIASLRENNPALTIASRPEIMSTPENPRFINIIPVGRARKEDVSTSLRRHDVTRKLTKHGSEFVLLATPSVLKF